MRPFHCYYPTRPLPINCKYKEVPSEYCNAAQVLSITVSIVNRDAEAKRVPIVGEIPMKKCVVPFCSELFERIQLFSAVRALWKDENHDTGRDGWDWPSCGKHNE